MKPLAGELIVCCDEEEMMKIGNTDLVLGYYDDNRNNAPWFGDVEAVGEGVPLERGEMVLFSYLSAKGSDKITSNGKLYIFIKFEYLLLVKRDGIEMLNGNILSLPAPQRKHKGIVQYEWSDDYYTVVAHVPKGSKFKQGDYVHYWMDKVYELEGQRKMLGKPYRVIKEENIISKLVDGKEHPAPGMIMVELILPKEKSKGGIILPASTLKPISKAKVVSSSCEIATGTCVYVQRGRGYEAGEYFIFKVEHVEAVCI